MHEEGDRHRHQRPQAVPVADREAEASARGRQLVGERGVALADPEQAGAERHQRDPDETEEHPCEHPPAGAGPPGEQARQHEEPGVAGDPDRLLEGGSVVPTPAERERGQHGEADQQGGGGEQGRRQLPEPIRPEQGDERHGDPDSGGDEAEALAGGRLADREDEQEQGDGHGNDRLHDASPRRGVI